MILKQSLEQRTHDTGLQQLVKFKKCVTFNLVIIIFGFLNRQATWLSLSRKISNE